MIAIEFLIRINQTMIEYGPVCRTNNDKDAHGISPRAGAPRFRYCCITFHQAEPLSSAR
jgi:hypothetical protein